MDDAAVREEVEAVEVLLGRLDELPEGEARTYALEAVEGLLRLYGEGLRRIVEGLAEAPAVAETLAADELVAQLMLLHDLHPATLEDRVAQALDEVRPYMGSHGGGIELVEIAGDVARVRLEGTCNGCGASTVTLKLAVEDAVLRAAPELRAVEAVEAEQPAVPAPTGVALPMLPPDAAAGNGDAGAAADRGAALADVLALDSSPGRWVAAGPAAELGGEAPLRRAVDGTRLLFARAGDQLYAYLDRCPACRAPLAEPRLDGDTLRCGGCERTYDVRRAGMAEGGGLLQLDPVPLLVEGGEVRVAVGAVAA